MALLCMQMLWRGIKFFLNFSLWLNVDNKFFIEIMEKIKPVW